MTITNSKPNYNYETTNITANITRNRLTNIATDIHNKNVIAKFHKTNILSLYQPFISK